MAKKTTTPALVRKYFERKAEVGDSSKDLIVEPDYVLVFTGKLPYQKLAQKRIIAWLPPSEKNFHVYRRNAFSEQIVDLVKKWAPKGTAMITEYTPIFQLGSYLARLTLAMTDTPEKRKSIIEKINHELQFVTEEEIWAYIDEREGFFAPLWSGENELSGLDDKLAVGIITRRLMS